MPDPQRYLVLGPIIGGLSHRSVRLWGRATGRAVMRAWLATSEDLSDSAVFGETELCEDTAYAGVIDISGLDSAQKYYYSLSLDSAARPPLEEFRSFKTFPAPGEPHSFRFAFGSCFRPAGPNPGRAFKHLLEQPKAVDFLVLEGDQIYSDDHKHNDLGHIALSLEDYRHVYLHTWSNPWHRELLRRTPVFMTLDDHEVDNDWHWHDREHTRGDIPFYTRALRWVSAMGRPQRELTTDRVHAALQAYREHQAMHSPTLVIPKLSARGRLLMVESPDGYSQAYSFYFGAAAFFVMDTRTQRVRFKKDHSVLGEPQWLKLEEWLVAVKDRFPLKFIVTSSAILFELWGDFANDRWSSFQQERDRLLHLLAAHGVTGMYFLAGDLHEGHTSSAELYGPDGRSIPVWEFSATPFEQQPNSLARIFKLKARSAAVRSSRIHYSIDRINYGIVDVSFSDPTCPRVNFELYYEDKGEWKMRRVETQAQPFR